MQFYRTVFTKEVNKRLREQQAQLPPGMEPATWDRDTGAASTQVDAAVEDALYREFIEEPPLKTLKDFTIQDLDTDITSQI
jgi:hypothetical protein